MEEQSTYHDKSSCKHKDKNGGKADENCTKRSELETVEEKSLTRKMEKNLRRKEAKKKNREEKLKRKSAEENDNVDDSVSSESSSPKKQKTNKEKNKDKELKRKLESVEENDNVDSSVSSEPGPKKKKKEILQKPSITLTLKNHFNKVKSSEELRLKMKDIQDLILYSLLWHSVGNCPRWCELQNRKKLKKVVVIALKSLGESDYQQNTEAFPYISKEFSKHVVQTEASGTDFSFKHPHESLLNVPLSKNQIKKELEKSLDAIKELGEDQIKSVYILSKKQLEANNYPPRCYEDVNADSDNGFVPCVVNEANKSTVKDPPIFAIDCEMCETSEGQELTRISVVDESLHIVYDSFVVPDRPILDYKTKYSGITANLLEGVKVRLQDVQKEIQRILPHNAILAGHSLNFDLQALKMYHHRIIDTSLIFGDKRGAHFKPALKYLAQSLLSKNIQKNSNGHCSIEDAKTVMELVKRKCEAGPSFGQTETPTEGLFHRIDREERKSHKKLVSAMVDYPAIVKYYQSAGNHAVSRVSDSEIASSAVNLINTSDFVWLHLHGAQHFYDGMARDDSNVKKDVFKTLDTRVSTVSQAIPENSLVVIIMGCGDVTEVLRIRRDPEPRNEELRRAVAEAKKGLCFFKVT